MRRGLVLSVLLSCSLVGSASAQVDRFAYKPGSSDVGTVLIYRKANFDGSNAGRIAVYRAGSDRLESFKWHEGTDSASLVLADMDWRTFTVRRFESWNLASSGARRLNAVLDQVGETPVLAIFVGGERQTLSIQDWPWHSYDFDFASLGAVFPHLVDPEAAFTIGISDVVYGEGGMAFANKGTVTLTYQATESRGGGPSRKYAIDGPGLENRGGHLWVDVETGRIVEYRIDLADEPGYENGWLRLESVERVAPTDWPRWMLERLAPEAEPTEASEPR